MSYWNKSKIELLKKYWAEGLSASAIAIKLGDGATRNSIIGKSHRLGLEARGKNRKTTSKTNIGVNNSSNKTQKLGRKAKFRALLLNPSFPEENPTLLEDLTDQHCRYPLGEKLEPAKFFCGRKPMTKYQYCELHMLFSYTKKGESEEDVITEEDLPVYEKKIKSA